jgi:thiamine transporter ThiT
MPRKLPLFMSLISVLSPRKGKPLEARNKVTSSNLFNMAFHFFYDFVNHCLFHNLSETAVISSIYSIMCNEVHFLHEMVVCCITSSTELSLEKNLSIFPNHYAL